MLEVVWMEAAAREAERGEGGLGEVAAARVMVDLGAATVEVAPEVTPEALGGEECRGPNHLQTTGCGRGALRPGWGRT